MAAILMLLSKDADRRLVHELLGARHDVVGAQEDLAGRAVDMIVADAAGLEHHWSEVRELREASYPVVLPVLLTMAQGHVFAVEDELWKSIDDMIIVPAPRARLEARVRNLLRLRSLALAQHAKLGDSERFNRELAERIEWATAELSRSFVETVHLLSKAAEFKDDDTGLHVARIGHYSVALARRLGQDETYCDRIFYASPMHDIGKMAIPDAVLLKAGPLDGAEWEVMKSHARLGAEMLRLGSSPYAVMGVEIAGSHHERWDGSGYPASLAGTDIPLSARIVAICDQYDALRSKRPYKPAFDHDRTCRIILEGDDRTSPDHLDPAIRSAFADLAGQFAEIYDAFVEESVCP